MVHCIEWCTVYQGAPLNGALYNLAESVAQVRVRHLLDALSVLSEVMKAISHGVNLQNPTLLEEYSSCDRVVARVSLPVRTCRSITSSPWCTVYNGALYIRAHH